MSTEVEFILPNYVLTYETLCILLNGQMYSARNEPGTSKMSCGSHVPCVASMEQYDIGYKYSTLKWENLI